MKVKFNGRGEPTSEPRLTPPDADGCFECECGAIYDPEETGFECPVCGEPIYIED